MIVYFIISGIVFLQALFFSCFGYILLGSNGTLERYYCAIKWPVFSQGNYLFTSVFSVLNFIFAAVFGFKYGNWFPIIVSVVYFFLVNRTLGTHLNPDLFLELKAKHGDHKALMDLEEIKKLRFVGRFML